MADDKTREDVVEENLDAVIAMYGPEALPQIQTQLLKDINISLALLVDGSKQ